MRVLGVSESLDARLYYTFNEGFQFLKSLNSNLSFKYLIIEILDLGLICIYSGLFKRGVRNFIFHQYPKLLIALIPGLFDGIETLSVILLLNGIFSYSVLNWLGIVTFLKWTSGFILFLMITYYWSRSKRA